MITILPGMTMVFYAARITRRREIPGGTAGRTLTQMDLSPGRITAFYA